jgi:hypothetical protein
MPEINYWAVLVAAVASMVVGSIWYGPLFGKMWIKGMGWDPQDKAHIEKMKKSAGPAYFQMFVFSLITSWVLAHVIWAFRTSLPPMGDIASGLQAGFWSWIGFVLPVKYGDKLWNNKAFKYVAVDLGYYLVNLLVAGIVIASW